MDTDRHDSHLLVRVMGLGVGLGLGFTLGVRLSEVGEGVDVGASSMSITSMVPRMITSL